MAASVAYLASDGVLLESFQEHAPEGAEIKWVDSTQSIEQQAAELEGVAAVIVSPSVYPVELARLTPSVRLVQTTSAGTDMIDKQTLGELGIRVANNGGGNADIGGGAYDYAAGERVPQDAVAVQHRAGRRVGREHPQRLVLAGA